MPAPDASTDSSVGSSADAADASPPSRDAGPVDAAPLPIVCASAPCATALVTTIGGYYLGDEGQGFCALLQDRTVACWGANASGQLGRGDEGRAIAGSSTAARVVGLEKVVALDHTCAVDELGATWCWGTGPFLRQGPEGESWTTEHDAVKLELPPATRVGFGGLVACVATSEGVLCWGYNDQAQIGPFETTPRYAWYPPRKIDLPSGPPIRQIAIGDATLIVREDGTILSWGANPPLGRISSLSPDPYASSLTIGGIFAVDIAHDNACATTGGIGYCWGGALPGASDSLNRAHPVDKLGRAYPKAIVTPEPIVEVATTRTVSQSSDPPIPYRWCAVAVSGKVYCWGFNDSGQAGDGTKDFAYDAVPVVGLPERAVSVRTTPSTTCALLTNGKIYCWGSNYDGQLGNRKTRGMALVPEEVVLP